jgi:predicted SAM-dependent methyltransferase
VNQLKHNVNRKYCVIDNTASIKPFFKFQNFPIKMGCTNSPPDKDIFFDMDWGVSENGIVQLTSMIPLDILYNDSHNPGTIGATWKKHHDDLSSFIQKRFNASNVLEIGAASGLLVDRFIELENNFNWDIIEPSDQDYIDPRINHHKLIFEDFENTKLYDTVIHSHLLEHIYNPIEFLLKVNSVMTEGGKQFISVPNLPYYLNEGFSNALNFEHTFFYNLDILRNLLNSCGFEILAKVEGNHSIFIETKKIESISSQNKIDFNYSYESTDLFNNYLTLMKETVSDVKSIKDNYQDIFLFGAHIFSQSLLNMGLDDVKISGILDNDPNKEGSRLYGTDLKVSNPSILKNLENILVVVKAGVYTDEIIKQLKDINLSIKII